MKNRSTEPIISPAWSPDGRNLAVTLSRDGGLMACAVAGRLRDLRR